MRRGVDPPDDVSGGATTHLLIEVIGSTDVDTTQTGRSFGVLVHPPAKIASILAAAARGGDKRARIFNVVVGVVILRCS